MKTPLLWASMVVMAGCALSPVPQPAPTSLPTATAWLISGYRHKDAEVDKITAPGLGRRGVPVEVTLHVWLPDASWSLEEIQVEVRDVDRTVTLRPIIRKPLYSHPPTYPPLVPPQAPPMAEKKVATTTFTAVEIGDYRLVPTRPNQPGVSSVVTIVEQQDSPADE